MQASYEKQFALRLSIGASIVGAALLLHCRSAFASEQMPSLQLMDRSSPSTVAIRTPTPADMSIPGEGGCNATTCLYTWTQRRIPTMFRDTFFIRTKSNGERLDQFGQILGAGDAAVDAFHFNSQVIGLSDGFAVFWRSADGDLRYRRVPASGDPGPVVTLAKMLANGTPDGPPFIISRTENDFVALWITSMGTKSSWNLARLNADGVQTSQPLSIAAPATGIFRTSMWNQNRLLVVTGGPYDRHVLVALSPNGQVHGVTKATEPNTQATDGPAVLQRREGRIFLIRARYSNGQFSLLRAPVTEEGALEADAEVVIASVAEMNRGWRTRMAISGNTGLLTWLRGTSSQDGAFLLGRRFDTMTGWIDTETFSVSGKVETALEDTALFASASHFIPVWNDPVLSDARTSCSRAIAIAGESGTPECKTLSWNGGQPAAPTLRPSGGGYLVGWKIREDRDAFEKFPRYRRYDLEGKAVDAAEFSLPRRSELPTRNGPSNLVLHDGVVSVLNAQNTELSPGLPLGPKMGMYSAGIWNGQRYFFVNQDNGNIFQRGNSLAGQFVAGNGVPEETTAGIGTWRASLSGGDRVSPLAMGTNRQQTLVVWMHHQPEGVRQETTNELALLDDRGTLIENIGFGDVNESNYSTSTACPGPQAIAGDSSGFIIACYPRNSIGAGIKLLGYKPGAAPWPLGIFSPTGMNNPDLQAWGDGIHIVWSREQEIFQSLVRFVDEKADIQTDRRTLPYAVSDPRIASADQGRSALVYVRGTGPSSDLVFHLLDPNATPPQGAASFDAGTVDAQSSTGQDATIIDNLSPNDDGSGCRCTIGAARPTRAPWATLFLLAIAVCCRRTFAKTARRFLLPVVPIVSILLGVSCEQNSQVSIVNVDALMDAMPDQVVDQNDGGTSPIDALASSTLPLPGPLPTFTPIANTTTPQPQPAKTVDAVGDCAVGVAAQIAGGSRFAKLQDALSSAKEGETVQICPGVHRGGFQVSKGINVAAFSRTAADTILDGANEVRVLRVAIEQGSSPFRLQHVTIVNGVANSLPSTKGNLVGGGMHVASIVPVEIDDCVFERNTSGYSGGAVRVISTSKVSIRRSTFRENRANYEGGALSVMTFDKAAWLLASDNVFERNTAGQEGGAIKLDYPFIETGSTSAVIERSLFRANAAGNSGGGIEISQFRSASGTVSITDCQFDSNRGERMGGAINTSISGSSKLLIQNCTAAANFASVHGSAYHFGKDFTVGMPDQNVQIRVTGGRIVGHGARGGAPAITGTDYFSIELDSVDLGNGSDDNPGGDIQGCKPGFGPGTTLTVTCNPDGMAMCQ